MAQVVSIVPVRCSDQAESLFVQCMHVYVAAEHVRAEKAAISQSEVKGMCHLGDVLMSVIVAWG